MPKFFMSVPDEAAQIIVTGEDAHHIGYALRSKVGDAITVCNTDKTSKTYGWDYFCHISAFDAHTVTLEVERLTQSEVESAISITLYQAVPKNDKFDTIVQKAVELGVNTIVPVFTKRCISRPDAKSQRKKWIVCKKLQQKPPNNAAEASSQPLRHSCLLTRLCMTANSMTAKSSATKAAVSDCRRRGTNPVAPSRYLLEARVDLSRRKSLKRKNTALSAVRWAN